MPCVPSAPITTARPATPDGERYPSRRKSGAAPAVDGGFRVRGAYGPPLKRLAARAGIKKRVHAYGLRYTHAAQLRAEVVDIAIISRQLGHASITTTARYLNHLAPRAAIEAMRRRS